MDEADGPDRRELVAGLVHVATALRVAADASPRAPLASGPVTAACEAMVAAVNASPRDFAGPGHLVLGRLHMITVARELLSDDRRTPPLGPDELSSLRPYVDPDGTLLGRLADYVDRVASAVPGIQQLSEFVNWELDGPPPRYEQTDPLH